MNHPQSDGSCRTEKGVTMKYLLGMDVGGTRTRIGAVLPDGSTLAAPCRVYDSSVLAGDADPAQTLAGLINTYLSSESLPAKGMLAAAAGMPASVSRDLNTLCEVPNIPNPNLSHYPLGSRLQQILQVPCLIDKDVNLLLRQDIKSAGLSGVVAAVYIGTGIGTAVSLDGRLLYGTRGFAMDVGHMPMFHVTERCGCGKTGCAETVASGRVLRSLRDRLYPETSMERLFTEHGEEEPLRTYVENCAYVPATLATVFDPSAMILGGGVVEMEDFPKAFLEEKILQLTGRAVAGAGFSMVYPEKDDARGVLGAALLLKERILL